MRKFPEINSRKIVNEPLAMVEIVSAVLNLIIIHPETNLPLGQPTITIAVDRCTRCILGYFVSFEPSSYVHAMKCLSHAINPKDYIFSKYPQIKNDWPCWGIPQSICIGSGRESYSKDLEAAALTLKIKVHRCLTGATETLFHTLNKSFIHTPPGPTFSNYRKRGDYDSKKGVILTQDLFEGLLHTWICDIYHQTVNRSTLRTPASLWRDLIDPAKQELPSSASIESLLESSDTGSITTDKIFPDEEDDILILATDDRSGL